MFSGCSFCFMSLPSCIKCSSHWRYRTSCNITFKLPLNCQRAKIIYRQGHSLFTHILHKIIHLNGKRTSTCGLHIGKGTLQGYLFVLRVLSFLGGRQGRRLNKNGGEGITEGFFACLNIHEGSLLWLGTEMFGQSSEGTRRWGTNSDMKNFSVTFAAQDCRVDACRDTNGGYVEQKWGMPNKLGEFLFPSVSRMSQPFPSLKCIVFMKLFIE